MIVSQQNGNAANAPRTGHVGSVVTPRRRYLPPRAWRAGSVRTQTRGRGDMYIEKNATWSKS